LAKRRLRLALWACILGAVLLVAARSSDASDRWLDGTTSQGGGIQAQVVDGKVALLGIDVRMHCPNGTWAISWSTRRGLHATETTTHHYRFHDQTGRRTMTISGRLDDGTLRGTVTAVEHFVEPGYGPYDCASGAVSFSARAG
jgi:hypothetical protein